MERRRLIVISYDISDDDSRRKVSQILEKFGKRVQYSVFECFLIPEELDELRSLIEPLIQPSTDSIRYYPLYKRCRLEIKVFGVGEVLNDDDYHII